MEKSRVQAFVAIIFGSLLAISALAEGSARQGALGQVQTAMRNLKRVDNLEMTYALTYSQKGIVQGEQADIWANMLDGNWISEHYTTDEDGTRLYLKQFCDGRSIYHYIEWSGEWTPLEGTEGTAVPNLDLITALSYDRTDVLGEKSEEESGIKRISYTFTTEHLKEEQAAQLSEMEASYASYEKNGASAEQLASVALSVEQYKQMTYEDMTVTYTIDSNEVLRGMEYAVTLVMPELVQGTKGDMVLGDSQKTLLLIRVDVERYNQDGTLNKIEQCKNEIMY